MTLRGALPGFFSGSSGDEIKDYLEELSLAAEDQLELAQDIVDIVHDLRAEMSFLMNR